MDPRVLLEAGCNWYNSRTPPYSSVPSERREEKSSPKELSVPSERAEELGNGLKKASWALAHWETG